MKGMCLSLMGAVLMGLSALCPSPAFARLAPSQLNGLMAESDVILQATVVRLEAGDAAARISSSAVLRVWRVLKGSYEPQTVTIRFSDEKHEQRITTLYDDRLLFLRKTASGAYEGTHYGRSYWPLKWTVGDNPKQVTLYVYPISIIAGSEALLKDAEVIIPDLGLERLRVKAIYLEDLIALLNSGR